MKFDELRPGDVISQTNSSPARTYLVTHIESSTSTPSRGDCSYVHFVDSVDSTTWRVLVWPHEEMSSGWKLIFRREG